MKICPIIQAGILSNKLTSDINRQIIYTATACYEEKCAWWDRTGECCVIKSLLWLCHYATKGET